MTTLTNDIGPVLDGHTTGRRAGQARSAATLVDDADSDPLVAGVGRFARDVLAPQAVQNDNSGVPGYLIGALRDLGALNHTAPRSHGGAALGPAADRRVHEHLAYGCLNTWLIWAQHAPIVGRIARHLGSGHQISPLAHQVLRGELLAGAGISDVRRFPHGHLTAVPTSQGWVFRGTVSWVSGWGLNDVLLLAAVDATTLRVVTALVPVSDRTVATALRLKAAAGSRTVRLRIDDVAVPVVDVIAVEPLTAWHATDRAETSDARPHVFGLTARILDELRDETAAADIAERWTQVIAENRCLAYGLAEEAKASAEPEYRVDERLAIKAAAAETLNALAQALLVARAGRGLTDDNTAQLHARSALFLLVQGQTARVRSVQLQRITEHAPTGDRTP